MGRGRRRMLWGVIALLCALSPTGVVAANEPTLTRWLPELTTGCVAGQGQDCPDWATTVERPDGLVSAFVADLALSDDGATAFVAGYGRDGENPFESSATGLVAGVDVATGQVRWQTSLQPAPYVTLAAIDAGDGIVVVTGKAHETFSSSETALLLAALDADTGAVLWEDLVNSSARNDIGRDVVIAPAVQRGRGKAGMHGPTVVVTGWHHNADGRQDAYTMAYDAAGQRQWTAQYTGVGNDIPWLATVAGDRVVVTMQSHGENSQYDNDIVTVAYALQAGPHGRELWRHRYDHTGVGAPDAPRAIAASPDGATVAVAGYSSAATSGPPYPVDYDAVVLVYDAATGTPRWITRWRQDGQTFPVPSGVVVTDDRVAFSIDVPNALGGGTDFATVALDAGDGSVAWTAVEGAPRADGEMTHAIAADVDGSRIVTVGHRSSSDTALVYGGQARNGAQLTVAYDATDGGRLWSAELRASSINNDRGRAVEVAPDGAVVTAAQLTRNIDADEQFFDIGLAAYR